MEEELNEAKRTPQELNDTIKRPNVRMIGFSEDGERKTGLQDVFNEIIEENFLNT